MTPQVQWGTITLILDNEACRRVYSQPGWYFQGIDEED